MIKHNPKDTKTIDTHYPKSQKNNRILKSYLFFCFLFCCMLSTTLTHAGNVAVLEVDINSFQMNLALKNLGLPAGIDTRFFTLADLTAPCEKAPGAKTFIREASVVFVNVMMKDLSNYMVNENLMQDKTVYAMNRAGDIDAVKKQGFIFDDKVMEYYRNLSVKNMVNMIRLGVHRHVDAGITFEPLEKLPETSIHHPDAPENFESMEKYREWYERRKSFKENDPWLAVLFYNSTLKEGQVEAAEDIVIKLEKSGFNVLPCFGTLALVMDRYLKAPSGKASVDMVLAFTMKFSSSINDDIRRTVNSLNVPVFNVIRTYGETIEEWRKSKVGLGPMETAWAVCVPEFSGALEPTVLSGKKLLIDEKSGRRLYIYETVDETLGFLIPRLKKWRNLQQKPNGEKKVAIIYYNHSQGKQNIGAAYLNVFRSLGEILNRMKQEGYQVENIDKITEKGIQNLVLTTGRNIGSWAPGELDAMLAAGDAEKVPIEEYRKWFEKLPPDFREKVLAQWGEPEASDIMTKDGFLVFPMVKLGNLVLLPEPARGWSDSPMKLYHDPTLYPHHQYIAAYLWLAEKFETDAMVHLGTHATYEWLPGKQAGLAPSDPPEIMVGSIPNIYPYIVDDVGEGIQAKRRGRGVIIDHLTPPMKEADLYNEYAELKVIMGKYELAEGLGSETAEEYFRQMEKTVADLGILKDLGLETFDRAAIEPLDLYLHEMDTNSLPYGLHTFGKAYDRDAAEETLELIMNQNPEAHEKEVQGSLELSPVQEMDNFIRALNGEYVDSGEGNDPLRNLAAIPTGRNFYGFSPAKVPSRAAWEIGKRAALQMIEKKLEKDGRYPEKVGVVLWATETTRNEGVHESTILSLIGVEPVWDATGRVTGSRVISGKNLGRPRIDVLINPSGLYRDMFPGKLFFLDEAVQKAMARTDIDNFLAKNRVKIKESLILSGMDEKEAETQSKFRIFTEETGSYGNGVSEMASASGIWESDEEISNVYMNRVQFAVGQGQWALPVKAAFKENLRGVDIAVHSRSSNVIGIIDTDDFFMYLGGMSLAVKNVKGKAPDTLVTLHRKKDELNVEDVSKTIGREMRTRYLNPQWIQGMKKDNYAGARQMADFVENLWGWQVTTADAVDDTLWQQIHEVYVEDKYGQDIKAFFNKHNPWAYQSMTARMLESARKGYWEAKDTVKTKLAVEYAVNTVEKGVACCGHTCNNPLLNQMVVNIISVPGVLSPEMVEQFKMAIEKMARKDIDEQVKERKDLQRQLTAGFTRDAQQTDPSKAESDTSGTEQEKNKENLEDKSGPEKESVEGYEMKEVKTEDTRTSVSSSGVQWFASLFVLVMIFIFMAGMRRKK